MLKTGMFILFLLFSSSVVIADEDDFGGFSNECPHGDGVLVHSKTKNKIMVDCISYDATTNSWIGTNIETGKIESFSVKDYSAWNIDGQLTISNLGKIQGAENESAVMLIKNTN